MPAQSPTSSNQSIFKVPSSGKLLALFGSLLMSINSANADQNTTNSSSLSSLSSSVVSQDHFTRPGVLSAANIALLITEGVIILGVLLCCFSRCCCCCGGRKGRGGYGRVPEEDPDLLEQIGGVFLEKVDTAEKARALLQVAQKHALYLETVNHPKGGEFSNKRKRGAPENRATVADRAQELRDRLLDRVGEAWQVHDIDENIVKPLGAIVVALNGKLPREIQLRNVDQAVAKPQPVVVDHLEAQPGPVGDPNHEHDELLEVAAQVNHLAGQPQQLADGAQPPAHNEQLEDLLSSDDDDGPDVLLPGDAVVPK